MATITLTDANSDGVGVDLLAYLDDFNSNFTRGYFGFFSDNGADLSGNEFSFTESSTVTVGDIPSTADSVAIGSGTAGDFSYDFLTHTLAGTLDSVRFGQGLSYDAASDSFSQSATDIAITGLGLSGSGTGNAVHTLIYDLMGGSSTVLLATLNAQSNTIIGSSGADTIYSFDGNDTFTGGAGSDFFVFDGTDGADTITDFSVTEDGIDVTAWGSYSITDTAAGAVLSYGSNSITVLGVTAADMSTAAIFV
ncbi:hypothetical protein GCM10007301_31000 [Azorhizobium oxalatiphilum]|uniref:Calcium-binding protein n=1 Tax=Azorhizobium oxalatiphilum TaxID=980631 RepID=A0A917FEY1_9HYPH|nr:hypothetical protein [Azorhizobium oxalatiphilum]GGF69108.1 hypothetical protein GCM10007301_31000 [Azorhizobium oxalatiphilum]